MSSYDIDGGTLDEVTITEKKPMWSAAESSKPINLIKETNAPKTLENPVPKKEDKAKYYNEEMHKDNKVRGFYYDSNTKNNLLSVSLHCNSEFDGKSWIKFSGPTDKENYVNDENEYPYSIEPLCRAIMTEDYQAAISNSWSEFGDDSVNNLFNQFKPYAPYLSFLSGELKKMNKSEEEMKTGSEEERIAILSTFGRFADKATDILEKLANSGADYLNRALVTKTGRYSYYSGTGVGFGNLTMKFTIFSDYIDGEFKSVNDQILKLYPYCFGKLTQFLDNNGSPLNLEDIFGETAKEVAERYFGWQIPPGGFRAELDNIDKVQFGTLKLKFGTLYAIDNLVCESATFQISKQMMKRWENDENNLYPLFCDVTITLKPASKFTDVKLRSLINGNITQKERQSAELILQDNINKKIEENKKLLGG